MPRPSQSLSTRLRASWRSLATGGLTVAALLTMPSAAQAGEYHFFACTNPAGAPASMADLRVDAYSLATGKKEECATGSSLYMGMPEDTTTSFLDWTGVGLTLPDGLEAKKLRAKRRMWLVGHDGGGPDGGANPAYEFRYGSRTDTLASRSGTLHESCDYGAGCSGYGWVGLNGGSDLLEVTFPEDIGFIGFTVGCRGGWGTCKSSYRGRGHLRVDALDVTIADDRAPVSSTPSGSLIQPGPRAGTESFTFASTDVGAGIYDAFVTVDGRTEHARRFDSATCKDAGTNPSSDLEFDRVQPCSLTQSASFTIDTRRFDEGKHRLEAYVRDAGGNLSNRISQDFVVDNMPPPVSAAKPAITGDALATGLRPGDAIVATNGAWKGGNITFKQRWQRSTVGGGWADIVGATGGTYRVGVDDIDRQLRVVVTATNTEGTTEAPSDPTAPVKSGKTIEVQSVQPGTGGVPGPAGPGGSPGTAVIVAPPAPGNGGGGNPATGQLVVDREQRTVDVRYGAKIVITGRLVDADTNPIANATVDVFEQLAVTAAPWTKVDTVKTDAQGGYVYRPKTTASRRLRFAYSDRRETSDYRATREVFVSVTAGMTIKAKRRVVPRRSLIRLNGKVLVDHLPKAGSWVEVQVLDAGVWRTVATRRLSATGGWSFKHRLRQSARITFAFRARLRTAGDLPSAEAKSSPVKVRVR